MYPCFETIKLIDGKMPLLSWHQKRMNHTRNYFYGCVSEIDLSKVIDVPSTLKEGLFKCKVVYEQAIVSVSFEPYTLAKHSSVALLEQLNVEYPFKAVNRSVLDAFKTKEHSDFIIVQNGVLTDAWYSNIALKKDGEWYTPTTPLLKGVKRQKFLEEGVIKAELIKFHELKEYNEIAFINAMRDFEYVYSFVVEKNILKLKLKT